MHLNQFKRQFVHAFASLTPLQAYLAIYWVSKQFRHALSHVLYLNQYIYQVSMTYTKTTEAIITRHMNCMYALNLIRYFVVNKNLNM